MPFNAGLTRCAARGCFVAFHPMCALLATKVGDKGGKAKSVRTRKTRHTEQATEEKKSDEEDEKLCKEYTLQLVQLTRTEGPMGGAAEEDTTTTTILPVAFCGIHNPSRADSCFGCLPGGAAI